MKNKNMKDWMRRKGLTIQSFSEAVGLGYSTCDKWMRGQTKPRRATSMIINQRFPDCPLILP